MSKYVNLLKNIGLFAISNVAIKLIVFLLTPLYTYYLSTSQFGITDMLNTVVSLILPIVTLSVSDAVLRFTIEDHVNIKEYISIGFLLTGLSCIVVLLLLPMLNLSIFGGLGKYQWWFFMAYMAMAFQTLGSNVARGLNQITLMTWASIFSAVTNCALAVTLIAVLGMGMEGFFISLIAGNVVGAGCYLIFGRHYRYLVAPTRAMRKYLTPMLVYALPLIPNSLFWWMNQSINRFFITGMIGIGASGLFAAASKIPNMLNLISGIFQQAWNLSAFQEFRNQDRRRFFNVIFQVYDAGMSICTVVLIVLSQWLASFLFQKNFYAAWTFVPILLLAFYFNSLNAFYGSIFTSSMKTRALFTTTMAGAVVCVMTIYPLIKVMGLQGAGIASALSTFVVLVMRMRASRAILNLERNSLINTLLQLALVATAVCVILQTRMGFTLAIVLGLAITMVQAFRVSRLIMSHSHMTGSVPGRELSNSDAPPRHRG